MHDPRQEGTGDREAYLVCCPPQSIYCLLQQFNLKLQLCPLATSPQAATLAPTAAVERVAYGGPGPNCGLAAEAAECSQQAATY